MLNIEACISLLKQEFEKDEMINLVQELFKRASYSPKWMLYSDCCLDDKNKPNDVLSFVLVPFISESHYQIQEKMISIRQPVDIKHSRHISEDYMEHIRKQALFSFSFIVNDRQRLFGLDETEQIKAVKKFIAILKDTFVCWLNNNDDKVQKEYFRECISKLNNQLNEIFLKKKVKEQIDVLLITVLATFITASILKQLPNLQIIGWFPDRDKTNETCEGLAVHIFNALLYKFMEGKLYQFCAGKPDSSKDPFYDNENRIADVICGTLADYNIKDNLISKDKFGEVLRGLIADNQFVKVYKLDVDEEKTHLRIIEIKTK